MKLDWLTKSPSPSAAARQTPGAFRWDPLQKPMSEKEFQANRSQTTLQSSPSAGQTILNTVGKLAQNVKGWFATVPAPASGALRQPFMLPEQRLWREQVKTYAENNFEEKLLSLDKKTGEHVVSNALAQGVRSADPTRREESLNLLKAYLTYSGVDTLSQLSPHAQMKMMIFSPHLTEGPLGKALLYESVLGLPLPQVLEFGGALRQDFAKLPVIAQALLLKQLMMRRKELRLERRDEADAETAALRKLIKSLVIQFYADKRQAQDPFFNQQDKIRLGFLKLQPVEEAYRQQLEEVERRYRLKLRQLKKRRFQKVAEADEERLRRIELIYETVENNLAAGLTDLDDTLDAVQKRAKSAV